MGRGKPLQISHGDLLEVVEPAGQDTHSLDPMTFLYLPTGHAVQACPSDPVKPLRWESW